MARDMIDNERSTAINPSEAIDEKVSLSDRFGLWLGFHNVDQDTYLAIINAYADAIHLDSDPQKKKRIASSGPGMGYHPWKSIRSGCMAIYYPCGR